MIRIYADNKKDNFKVWNWLISNRPCEFDANLNKVSITVYCKDKEEQRIVWEWLSENAINEIARMEMGK